MAVATINLTVDDDFLEQIDTVAMNESRSRTDLIRNSMKNPAASSGVSSFREECDCMWGYIPHFVDVAIINRPKGRGMYPTGGIKMYIDRKKRLQELFAYGERIAAMNKFTEEDVMEEIKNYRKNK